MSITCKFILSFILMIALTGVVAAKAKMDRPIVKNVDLNRYIGTWYEIARFDHTFERNLVGVTATYTLLKNGKIQVLNQGYLNTLDGKHKKAKGIAKLVDSKVGGHLKVSFFRPFYADYFIMALDEQTYEWALVGSKSMSYLWILSRKPQLDPVVVNNLIKKAQDLGYDTSKLIMVKQAKTIKN